MSAYYNEIEPFAAQWLRNLIARNLIAPGDVDERSIVEVQPNDLRGYAQCHFFAGIGGWGYALRIAGWADDRPVWTGSCPCQPFSTAGKQRGSDDERHLWPAFFRLIRECRPATVFGEQVAGAAGYAWWDHVAADLEGEGYAAAACDIGAHSVGAPHIRQRLFWVADADRTGSLLGECDSEPQQPGQQAPRGHDADGRGPVCGMGDADDARLERRRNESGERAGQFTSWQASPWSSLEWLQCSDGKARPTQPGLFPLAHGLQSSLVRCGDIEAAAIQEVLNASIDPDPGKALRVLWQALRTTVHQWTVGGPWSIHSTEILLAFMLSLRAACNATAYGSGGAQASKAVHWRALRFLRMVRRLDRSPHRRQPVEQPAHELTDVVRVLSLNMARHAEAYWFAAEDAYASTNRVGRLRAYGNAIVPQVAAEFIGAVMERRP